MGVLCQHRLFGRWNFPQVRVQNNQGRGTQWEFRQGIPRTSSLYRMTYDRCRRPVRYTRVAVLPAWVHRPKHSWMSAIARYNSFAILRVVRRFLCAPEHAHIRDSTRDGLLTLPRANPRALAMPYRRIRG